MSRSHVSRREALAQDLETQASPVVENSSWKLEKRDPLVSIIVVTYNGHEVITECLESIKALRWPKREVIVVDNASSDNTLERVSRIMPTSHIIRLSANRGYGGGANVGAREAKGEILLFANQDVSLDERFLDGIISTMNADDSIGVCGGIVIAWDKSWLVSTGQIFERLTGYGLDYGFGSLDLNLRRETDEVFSPNGAAFAVKRETFLKIGGFDEDLFMYFDETDLAWRARMAGARIVCSSDSLVRHKIDRGRAYSTLSRYYIDRNSLLSATRNYGFRNIILYVPVSLGMRVAGAAILILSGRSDHARSMAMAIRDFLVRFPKTWRKRHTVQSTRKLTDKQVMEKKVLAEPGDVMRAFYSSLLPSTMKRKNTMQ
ncbi:MAG TPA: glycosyltransferase family 2 protein [Candidatus Sulfotelmatobacter sp.]|nr:glycosyltransferase family 2 protein [Candidatus Sulfotelmatobacter sp.]